jgi:hypothetical protein
MFRIIMHKTYFNVDKKSCMCNIMALCTIERYKFMNLKNAFFWDVTLCGSCKN